MLIAAVLAASVAASALAANSRNGVLLVLGAMGAILVLVVWSRSDGRMPLGVLAIAVSAGLLNFITLPTGTDSRLVLSLVLALLVTALWVADSLLVRRSFALIPSPLNMPVLAWAVVSVASFAWSMLMRDPLVYSYTSFLVVQAGALIVNVLLPLMILLVIQTLKDERWLDTLIWITLGVGAVVIWAGWLGLPLSRLYANGTRGLFGMWVVTMAAAVVLFDQQRPTWQRVALALLAGAWFHQQFVLHGAWISGWLPMVMALFVLAWLRSKPLFVLMVVVALAFVAANASELYLRIVVSNVEEGSMSRLDIWKMSLGHVVRHPLLGMGPAGYALYNMTYHPLDARSTHNNFFDVLAQTGIIGFTIFLWLMATVLRVSHMAYRRLKQRHDMSLALAAGVAAGTVGAMVGMMLGDWVLPFAYNQTISGFDNAVFTWLFFGAVGALEVITRAPMASTELPERYP
jgi:O-antigen ligase